MIKYQKDYSNIRVIFNKKKQENNKKKVLKKYEII